MRQKKISLKIYDIDGREVRTFNHLTNQSFNQIIWDGKDAQGNSLPTGIYFCRMEAGEFKATKKLTILR